MLQSHCFLLQTDLDIWGPVLIEAVAVGIPCISSIHAGATHDLITDGVTGFAVNFSGTEEVVDRVNCIPENPELSKEIGQNAAVLSLKMLVYKNPLKDLSRQFSKD